MAVQWTVLVAVAAVVPVQTETGAPEVVTVPTVALVAALLPETTVKKTNGATLKRPVTKVMEVSAGQVIVPDCIT